MLVMCTNDCSYTCDERAYMGHAVLNSAGTYLSRAFMLDPPGRIQISHKCSTLERSANNRNMSVLHIGRRGVVERDVTFS
jgi:hypothetical protein